MNVNPMQMMQFRQAMDRFTAAHPKLMPFCHAVMRDGIEEGTVIEMKVTTAQGKNYISSIRITAEDKVVVYSGDVRSPDEIADWSKNCDALLMESGHHHPWEVCARWKESMRLSAGS